MSKLLSYRAVPFESKLKLYAPSCFSRSLLRQKAVRIEKLRGRMQCRVTYLKVSIYTYIIRQMVVVQLIIASFIASVAISLLGSYTIKEGHVGLVKSLGVVGKDLIEPGYHIRLPFIQQIIQVKTTMQTEEVTDIPCGTSNGLLINFGRIEVVNQLDRKLAYETIMNYSTDYSKFWISDKVHHAINQFCSKHTLQEIYIEMFDQLDEAITKALNKDLEKWAPGLKVSSIRVTKPKIPEKIMKKVQEMQKMKVEYLIALEKEKVTIQQVLMQQTQRRIKAESDLEVKKINAKQMVQKMRNKRKMAKIESSMIYSRKKTEIDTRFLAAFSEAQINGELFTDKYLRFLTSDAITSNVTLIMGDKVPSCIFEGQKESKRQVKKKGNKGSKAKR